MKGLNVVTHVVRQEILRKKTEKKMKEDEIDCFAMEMFFYC